MLKFITVILALASLTNGIAGSCRNLHHSSSDCDVWAKYGHCKSNPQWMEKNCAKSCKKCPSTAVTTVAPTDSIGADCPAKFKKVWNHSACLPKSPNAKSVVWTDADKQSIVDQHNKLRGSVNPPATNMMKMSWDDELALVAQGWADACETRRGLNHDSSERRLIPGGFRVGQNAASTVDYTMSIKMWWDEVKDYRFGTDYNYQWAMIGHYTQMAWAGSYKVGCGAATCGTGRYADQFLACNYGPAGNMLPFSSPYNSGVSGKDCKKSSKGLCDCGDISCNSGSLQPDTCQCDCSMHGSTPKFMNKDCSLNCGGDSADHYYCQWNNDCRQGWIKEMCPHRCGVCPAAGK